MSDFPKNDTVVSLAAMRRELLLKKRLSPTVSERERRRLALETAGPNDEIAIPLFQAFVSYCYLEAAKKAPEAQKELFGVVMSAMERRRNGWPFDLLAPVSAATFAEISSVQFTDVVQTMQGQFQRALVNEGYELI